MAANKKNTKTVYVSTSAAKSLANYLMHKGIEIEKLEAVLGQSLEALEAVDARLPIQTYQSLWKLAIEFTDDPALGLVLGSTPRNEEMGLVGHIFFNNATLGDALRQYERFYSLINDGMHLELIVENELVQVQFVCDQEQAYCLPDMERTLAIAIQRARENISKDLAIEYVGFQHAAPQDPGYFSMYQSIFPCPVRFDQAHTHFVFKEKYLDFKLPNRSSYLHSLLNRHIEGLLKKIRPEPSLTNKVKALVERKLSKDSVDAAHIAEKLHMSRHTLYRKLKQEGIAFHELVDEVREAKAIRYLEENQHSLSEIAFLLGFSELSAFSRAFKRWTGQSPAKYVNQKANK